MQEHHIEIHQPTIAGFGTTVKIDGKYFRRIRGIEYHCPLDELPEIKITTIGTMDFDINADYIKLDISPENIKDAVIIMQHELLKHEDVYDAFVSSIESSLKEQSVQALPFQPTREIAERIVKRISGEE